MVDIPESKLNNLIAQVRDHVKKFVVPHIKNDNEKNYYVPVTDNDGSNIKFYVNTTNDENQSNCKYTPGYKTIKTTRLIKEGEELMLFYEMPDIDVQVGTAQARIATNLIFGKRLSLTGDQVNTNTHICTFVQT